MKTYQTNVQFVTELMEFSNYGALAQLFVLQALSEFSHAVVNAEPESFENSAHFISTQAWQGVAKEIAEKIEQRHIQS